VLATKDTVRSSNSTYSSLHCQLASYKSRLYSREAAQDIYYGLTSSLTARARTCIAAAPLRS